jgi:hypothetical protein
MTDFTTNPGPPPTAEAPREPTDPDVEFLVNYADSLRRYAEQARVRGRVFGPECVDVQAPIFERIADRLRAASPSLGELGTLLDEYVRALVWFENDWKPANKKLVRDTRAALDARLSALVAEREAAKALSAAATEVNDRYIGGSPLKGRLGDAIDALAQANARMRWARAAHPPEGSHGR